MQQAYPDPHPALGMTLRQVFELYYRPELLDEDRLPTLETFNSALRLWEETTDNPPVALIENATLENFRSGGLGGGKRPSTVRSYWRSLRAILRRIGPQHDRNPRGLGLLSRLPYMRPIRVDLEFPRVITFAELDAVYAACHAATWPATCVPAAQWWRVALVLFTTVGARRLDVFSLRPDDIDFERRLVRFVARKTRRAQSIPLTKSALAHLRSIWGPREFIFPGERATRGRLRGRGYRDQWLRLQDLAGIRPYFGVGTLRKTCGSLYADSAGTDVAAYVLGHYIPGVTKQFYINPTRRIAEAVNNLPLPESFKAAQVYCVSTHRRTDFTFQPGSATYREKVIRLPRRPLAVLQALVAAGRPLAFADLRRSAFLDSPQIADRTIKSTVCHLRRELAKALRPPANWSCIRWDRFGNAGYLLTLPPTPCVE